MPEETAPVSSETTKKEVNLDASPQPEPKTLTFKKTKFITFLILGLLLAFAAVVGSYYLGQSSVKEEVLAKKDEVISKKEQIPDVVEVGLGEDVIAKNGISVELVEAKFDQAYENQKEEQKKFYEKTSSNSANLDSEYFKTSNLVLKISLTNTKDIALNYSPADFRLKDSNDNQYTSGYAYEGSSTPTIYSLNPSETTKLTQSYIVPTTEKSYTLIYQNVVINFTIK